MVVELKYIIDQETKEWMYAIQGARSKDPFAEYNELVTKLFSPVLDTATVTFTAQGGVEGCGMTRESLKSKLKVIDLLLHSAVSDIVI